MYLAEFKWHFIKKQRDGVTINKRSYLQSLITNPTVCCIGNGFSKLLSGNGSVGEGVSFMVGSNSIECFTGFR